MRIAAHWTRGRARVDTERDIAVTRERANGRVGVEHKDKVGDLRADLGTPTDAASTHKRRTGPASAGAGNYYTLPAFTTYPKTHFEHTQDREPLASRRMRAGIPFSGILRKSRRMEAD